MLIIKISRLAWSASTRCTFSHVHGASLHLSLLKTVFLPCLTQTRLKVSMTTSLHFIECSQSIILLYDRQNRIYNRTNAFTLSGFTTAFKAALNEWNTTGHRVVYIIITHRNGEMINLKIHWSCRQCSGHDRASSDTCAPNALSALASKAFKVIVSCLTVW